MSGKVVVKAPFWLRYKSIRFLKVFALGAVWALAFAVIAISMLGYTFIAGIVVMGISMMFSNVMDAYWDAIWAEENNIKLEVVKG